VVINTKGDLCILQFFYHFAWIAPEFQVMSIFARVAPSVGTTLGQVNMWPNQGAPLAGLISTHSLHWSAWTCSH